MTGLLLAGLVAAQAAQIGSALSEGVELVYESGGVAQAPWVYDSVRVVERADFDRCIVTQRRSEPARESCVRADTLFERTEAGAYRAVRPIGPDMYVEVPSASGDVLHYSTGEIELRRFEDGLEVAALATTIVTYDRSGTITRRLHEHYAPSLLTAVSGVFEVPDESGGWTSVLEFSLSEVRRPRTPPSGVGPAGPASRSQEGFRAWVGLYDPGLLGWLENENRIGELCGDAADPGTCYADHLRPAISVYPLHREADASSPLLGELVVAAVPGRGFSAHFRAAGSSRTVPFEPDLYLQDWGYGPYFHQTVVAQEGDWFGLPSDPWDGPAWVHRGSEARDLVMRVHAGDIIEFEGQGSYVVEAESDALVLRREQPADMWCEAGDAPPVVAAPSRRVPRAALSDSVGRLSFRPRYLKGC